LYLFGDAQNLNSEEGFFWLKESAMQDFGPAQHNLGTMYAQGISGEPNLKRAYAWLTIASASIAQAEEDSLIIREKLSENELQSSEMLIAEITAQIANDKEL
jgi:TPR repeat protein